MSLEDRHDAQEEERPELAHHLAVLDVLADLVREPDALPDLLAEEPVAHQVARVDAELLALVALGVGELRVEVAQARAVRTSRAAPRPASRTR